MEETFLKTTEDGDFCAFAGGCILEPDQCKFLWTTSWITLGSSMYALKNKHYDLTLATGAIFLTSINYWRLPRHCWRRNLDIATVHTTLFYQGFRALGAQNSAAYFVLFFSGAACYPISNYYYSKKKYWLSTYFHGGIHILTNIGNFVLYSGSILPIHSTLTLLKRLF